MGISRISVDIKAINTGISRSNLRRCAPSDITAVRRAVTGLWEPLTSVLHEQVASGHECTLSTETNGNSHLILNVGEQRIGTLKDPLGISARMAGMKLASISFVPNRSGTALAYPFERALIGVLSTGFEPQADLFVADDIFVDAAVKGLPVSDGIIYRFAEENRAQPKDRVSLKYPSCDALARAVTPEWSADEIVQAARPLAERSLDSVCRILMSRTRKFLSPDIPVGQRDPDSAIKLWEFIAEIDSSFNQRSRLKNIMCHVAKQVYPLDVSAVRRDIASAVKLWDAARRIIGDDEVFAEDSERIRKSMMDVANKAVSSSVPVPERDVDAAIAIWANVHAYNYSPASNSRVILTMMDIANKITSFNLEADSRDYEGAVKIWRQVCVIDPRETQTVVETMLSVANRIFAQPSPPVLGEINGALRIWSAAYTLTGDDGSKQGIINNAVNILSLRQKRSALSLTGGAPDLDGVFRSRVLVGLLYTSRRYEDAISIVDGNMAEDPGLLYLKCECLRKLIRYEDSEKLATEIIHSRSRYGDFSKVQAYVCRGYCRVHLSAGDKQDIKSALSDFDAAIKLAAEINIPIPPRAFTGIGFAYMAAGDEDKAQECFRRALELDPANYKAQKMLRD